LARIGRHFKRSAERPVEQAIFATEQDFADAGPRKRAEQLPFLKRE
jgi:hypothetical protein